MTTLSTTFKKTQDQSQACKLLCSQASNILLFGGSRSGKTIIILRQIVLRALKAPYSRHCIIRRHFIDVRKSILMDTFPKLMRIGFPNLPFKENKSTSVITFLNGSEIWFGGLDKTDKILGNEYATIFFNEVSEIEYEQIEIAHSRLAQKCLEITNKFFYDCNPPSKAHWSYKLFILKENPRDRTTLKFPDLYSCMRLNPDGNTENIAESYISTVLETMSGRNRKRFLLGQWADDNQNALWKRDTMISPFRIKNIPHDLERVVVAVDPAVTKKESSDHTGIIVAARKKINSQNHFYILDDLSLIASPAEWSSTVVNAYDQYHADRIVAEVNQGGDLVESVIRNVRRNISFRSVRATRGKILRAEPVAQLYERGLVHHVGEFSLLEDELCSYCGSTGEDSPDRLDALVWALTELSGNYGNSGFILA